MRTIFFISASLFLLASWSPVFGQLPSSDWMQFRGPNGTGRYHASTPLPSVLDDENLKWRIEIPEGHSSPIVIKNCIVFTGFESGLLSTLCVDWTTGKLRWRRDVEVEKFEKSQAQHGPATPTPVSDGERIFVVFGSYGVLAYDLEGDLLWQDKREMRRNLFGSASSPIMANGKLVVFAGNQEESLLQVMNPATGAVVWQRLKPGPASSWSTPVLWQADSQSMLLVYEPFKLQCVALADGSDVWTVPNLADEPITIPLIQRDSIITTSYNMRLNQEAIGLPAFEDLLEQCDSNGDGMLDQEECKSNKSVLSRPDADGQGDHPLSLFFRMLDANKNLKIQANEYPRLHDWIDSFEHANGFIAIRPGTLDAVPELAWTQELGVPECPSPIVCDGKLFAVRNGGVVTCLEVSTGKQVYQGRYAPGGPYYASLVSGDGKLYLASERGHLTILSADENHKLLANFDVGESIHATPALMPNHLVVRSKSHLWLFGMPSDN